MQNLALDPGFESGLLVHDSRLVASGVEDVSKLVCSDYEHTQHGMVINGEWSLRVECLTNTSGLAVSQPLISVAWGYAAEEGQSWSSSVVSAYASGGLRGRLALIFSDETGTPLAGGSSSDGAAGGTDPEVVTVLNQVAPFGTAFCWVYLQAVLAIASSIGGVTFDDLQVVQGETDFRFLDGEQRGAYHDGVRYFSPSNAYGDTPTFEKHKTWVPAFMWSDPVSGEEL